MDNDSALRKERIKEVFQKSGIVLSDQQISQFDRYYEMLIEKNKVMNLTTIVDFHDVLLKHFIDSVIASDRFIKKKSAKLIDVGTGAGFPGIPLKILYPDLRVTLLDSLNKRLLFIKEVVDELSLHHVELLHARAEDAARQKEYRERFDYSVARAVANMSTLCEYSLPFIREGGILAAYKAENIDEELKNASKAIMVLGGKLTGIEKVTLPELQIERNILLITKIKKTPSAYPRKAGIPGKEPINGHA